MLVSLFNPASSDPVPQLHTAVRNTSTAFGRQYSVPNGTISARSQGSETNTAAGFAESESISSESNSPMSMTIDTPVRSLPRISPTQEIGVGSGSSLHSSGSLRRAALSSKPRASRAQVIVMAGPPGYLLVCDGFSL